MKIHHCDDKVVRPAVIVFTGTVNIMTVGIKTLSPQWYSRGEREWVAYLISRGSAAKLTDQPVLRLARTLVVRIQQVVYQYDTRSVSDSALRNRAIYPRFWASIPWKLGSPLAEQSHWLMVSIGSRFVSSILIGCELRCVQGSASGWSRYRTWASDCLWRAAFTPAWLGQWLEQIWHLGERCHIVSGQ